MILANSRWVLRVGEVAFVTKMRGYLLPCLLWGAAPTKHYETGCGGSGHATSDERHFIPRSRPQTLFKKICWNFARNIQNYKTWARNQSNPSICHTM